LTQFWLSQIRLKAAYAAAKERALTHRSWCDVYGVFMGEQQKVGRTLWRGLSEKAQKGFKKKMAGAGILEVLGLDMRIRVPE